MEWNASKRIGVTVCGVGNRIKIVVNLVLGPKVFLTTYSLDSPKTALLKDIDLLYTDNYCFIDFKTLKLKT